MPGDASRSALLRFAHDLLDETDAIALRLIEGPLAVTTKPKQALVTRVDTEIETHLRDRIGVAHPGHAVLGEEFGTADDAGHGRWIIDPIDATHNLVRGIDVFATLLAFERDGELEIGLVSAPALRRRWFAARGDGAHLRTETKERPIGVSEVASLAKAQIVFSTLRGLDAAGARRRPATADRARMARPRVRRLLGPHARGTGIGRGDARIRRGAVGHGRAVPHRDGGRWTHDRSGGHAVVDKPAGAHHERPASCRDRRPANRRMSTGLLLQACVGLDVDAVASTVHISNARLPLFLDHLQLENIAVGDARVDLRLQRQREGVGVELLERRGAVAVVNVK